MCPDQTLSEPSAAPTSPASNSTQAPIVTCRGLEKHYQQGAIQVPALRGIDLNIYPGDFATLAGPSGSGKTTLLNMIGGLDLPSAGSVMVDGQNLSQMNKTELAEMRLHKIGFVFQAYNLIPVLSALENIEFTLRLARVPAKERHQRALAALREVDLEGLGNRRPSHLSGGQQQRVAVARALIGRPAIVLADEPTANLDTKTAEELIDLMSHLNTSQGITFLMGTHDARVIARSRRHLEITDGRIIRDDTRSP